MSPSNEKDVVSPLTIRGCDALVRPGELLEGVDVELSNGRIESVAKARPHGHASAVLDGAGLLAIPGLINAHTHSPENPLRGMGEGLRLEPWLLLMFGTSGPYDEEDHYACALAGAAEMMKVGVTGVIDHPWMNEAGRGGAEAVLRAYRDAGLRAAVAPMMEDCDITAELAAARGIRIAPANMTTGRKAVPPGELIAQLDDLIETWHGSCDGRLKVFAGPGGLQWCSEELVTGLAELARSKRTGLHIHLLETALQREACLHHFSQGGVRTLEAMGVLGPNVSLAHTIWIESGDAEVIAAAGAIPVHNPAANLRVASGTMPVNELLDAGATVALGTDGAASSDNQNLWDAVKLACLVHNADSHSISSFDSLSMATEAGAAAMGDAGRLGALEPGRLADIALLDRSTLTLAGSQVIEPALALSDCGASVKHVIVAGDLVVRDGCCVRIDERAVTSGLVEQAQKRAHSDPSASVRTAMERIEELLETVD